jgi:hypothetical protein
MNTSRFDHIDRIIGFADFEQVVVCINGLGLHVLAHLENDLLIQVAKHLDAAYEVDQSRRKMMIGLRARRLDVDEELRRIASSICWLLIVVFRQQSFELNFHFYSNLNRFEIQQNTTDILFR